MRPDNVLKALQLFYNTTHVTQIEDVTTDKDIAGTELIYAMHLNRYYGTKLTGLTLDKYKELLKVVAVTGGNEDSAIQLVESEYGSIYRFYYATYKLAYSVMLLPNNLVLSDADSQAVYAFLQLLQNGSQCAKQQLLTCYPQLDIKYRNSHDISDNRLAAAVAELYYQQHGKYFHLGNKDVTREYANSAEPDVVKAILNQMPFKREAVIPYVSRQIRYYKTLSKYRTHMLCQYPIDANMWLFRFMYNDYVVSFILIGNTIVHNSYDGLSDHVSNMVDDSIVDGQPWYPDYVKAAEEAGDNTDYEALFAKFDKEYHQNK